jgi:hypothetical protein
MQNGSQITEMPRESRQLGTSRDAQLVPSCGTRDLHPASIYTPCRRANLGLGSMVRAMILQRAPRWNRPDNRGESRERE